MKKRTVGRTLRRSVAWSATALIAAMGLVATHDVVTAAPAQADAAQCDTGISLVNSGFEDPQINRATAQIDSSQVPGWQTTDDANKVEIWSSASSVPPSSGNQFAELNATSASMLYQTVETVPGETLGWSLDHRGRSGEDVMRVMIGPDLDTLSQNGPELKDGTSAWGTHTGEYVVPAGQTTTVFGFEAVSAAGGKSVGNFLDNINFGTSPCLETTKTVENVTSGSATANVGDTLRYTVVVANEGGTPAKATVATDELQAGLSYVDGTLIVDGSAQTDASGDDLAEVTGDTVTARLGAGAGAADGGTLLSGEQATYSFDATVTDAAATAGEVLNSAVTSYHSDLGNQDLESVSNEVGTPVNAGADLAIEKSLDTETMLPGKPVEFTITVTNNGPQDATGVTMTDTVIEQITDVTASGPAGDCTVTDGTVECLVGALASGESATMTVTGTLAGNVSADDIVENTASVTGDQFDPNLKNNTSTVNGTLAPFADLAVTKQANANVVALGDTLTYTLSVVNNGPRTAEGVTLTDVLPGELIDISEGDDCSVSGSDVTCDLGSLDVGDEKTVTISAVVDPSTVSSEVTNTATVDSDTADIKPENNTSTVTTDLTSSPAASFEKTVFETTDENSDGKIGAGDTISYSFTATNTGDTTLTELAITDDMLGGAIECAALADPLAPGAEVTCESDAYTITQDDVDNGLLKNTATLTATTPRGDAISQEDSVDYPLTAASSISVAKTASDPVDANSDGRIGAGDTVSYTFTVENTGDTTLKNVVLVDDMLGGEIACDALEGDLAPGKSVECGPIEHVLTQDDVNAGAVHNEATVTADAPDRSVSDDTAADVTVEGTDAIELVKQATAATDANDDGRIGAGDTIGYTFTVRNVGTTTLSDASITDSLLGGDMRCDALDGTSLAPGDEVECAPVTYEITQADVEAGTVHNTATAEAQGAGTVVSDPASVDVNVQGTPEVALVKTAGEVVDANDSGGVDAGDTVTYSFTATNTGTVVISDLAIDDPRLDGDIECDVDTLDPGESTSCTGAPAELTQAEVDAGEITNTATLTGTTSNDEEVTATDTVVKSFETEAAIALVKETSGAVDTNESDRVDAGDTMNYTFTVTNTGAVTLSNAQLSDPLLGGGVECAALDEPLAPGASVTCDSSPYTLTQGNIDDGEVYNEATVTATGPAGNDVAANDDVVTPLETSSSVSLTKAAGDFTDVDGDERVGAGDTVAYTFTVTNTGVTTISDLELADPMLGGTLECDALDAPLAPGASVDCGPVEHVLTQADVDDGTVTNTATVTASSPHGPLDDDSTVETTVDGTNAIDLVKRAGDIVDVNEDGMVGAGDTVDFEFTVTNTGTTTLTNAELDDELLGGDLACDALGESLAPGKSADCGPVTYELTQADIDRGVVHNSATVAADGTNGSVSDESAVDVSVVGTAAIDLVKDADGVVDSNGSGRDDAGDTVDYTFTVTNAGTRTLENVDLVDPRLDGVECDVDTLAPGESVDCTADPAVLTQAELDDGKIINTATVTATTVTIGDGDVIDPVTVEATDSVTVAFDVAPAVELTKTGGNYVDANGNKTVDKGDTVSFGFEVTNVGPVTLTDATITDPMLGGVLECEFDAIAPGESATCGPIVHTLTAAQAEAGVVENTATVDAMWQDQRASDSDTAVVKVTALAVTGAIMRGLAWGVLLLMIGGGVLMIARKRRNADA